jgi:hypothetical protein
MTRRRMGGGSDNTGRHYLFYIKGFYLEFDSENENKI